MPQSHHFLNICKIAFKRSGMARKKQLEFFLSWKKCAGFGNNGCSFIVSGNIPAKKGLVQNSPVTFQAVHLEKNILPTMISPYK